MQPAVVASWQTAGDKFKIKQIKQQNKTKKLINQNKKKINHN
jgi:hypothetical protein